MSAHVVPSAHVRIWGRARSHVGGGRGVGGVALSRVCAGVCVRARFRRTVRWADIERVRGVWTRALVVVGVWVRVRVRACVRREWVGRCGRARRSHDGLVRAASRFGPAWHEAGAEPTGLRRSPGEPRSEALWHARTASRGPDVHALRVRDALARRADEGASVRGGGCRFENALRAHGRRLAYVAR